VVGEEPDGDRFGREGVGRVEVGMAGCSGGGVEYWVVEVTNGEGVAWVKEGRRRGGGGCGVAGGGPLQEADVAVWGGGWESETLGWGRLYCTGGGNPCCGWGRRGYVEGAEG